MMQKPNQCFRNLPLGTTKPQGWIQEQMVRDLEEGFAGRLDQLTERASTDLFRDRIDSSKEHEAWWDSETRGNWLWGYVMMAYLADHDQHKARVDQLMADLKATQDDDDYIGIYAKGERYNHPPGENGELWGQSRALLSMLAYYELIGDETYLTAVEKAMQLTMKYYGPGKSYFQIDGTEEFIGLGGLTHGLCFVDVAEWLYALTDNEAYRDFGIWLYQDFCNVPGRFPDDDMKLQNLLIEDRRLAAHAVHPAEHLRAVIWAYFMTGDIDKKRALENAFKKLRLYTVPSGALIGDEAIHGLPMPDVGYEYCTMTELMLSMSSAVQKYGTANFAEWIENLTFNAAQGARFTDGSGVCYLSLENRFQATADLPDSYAAFHRGGRYKYSPTHEDVACCCNPNAVRLMPHYVSRMWMRLNAGDGLVAATYGPSTLTTSVAGVPLTIVQETNYPFSDTILFKVSPETDVEFSLHLRKPAWATQMQVDIQGGGVREESGYMIVNKKWAVGDVVAVTFTAEIEAVYSANGEYSIRRGPLQYAMNIPHEAHSIKSYPLDGFHDYDIMAQDLKQAYQVLILDTAKPSFGLEFATCKDSDERRPWDNSPVMLKAETMQLVPMGSTVLRRSTFPMKRTNSG